MQIAYAVLPLKKLYDKSRCANLEKCKARVEGWTKDRRVDGKQPEPRPSKERMAEALS